MRIRILKVKQFHADPDPQNKAASCGSGSSAQVITIIDHLEGCMAGGFLVHDLHAPLLPGTVVSFSFMPEYNRIPDRKYNPQRRAFPNKHTVPLSMIRYNIIRLKGLSHEN